MAVSFNLTKKPSSQPSQKTPTPSENTSQSEAMAEQIQRAISDPSQKTLTVGVVQQLQRQHGNHFVSRLIQRTKQTPSNNLVVGAANDSYEREAEQTARQ